MTSNKDMPRFYIDERGSCIAVCDSTKEKEKGYGLSASDDHVVDFWMGGYYPDSDGYSEWRVPDWAISKAKALLA